MPVALSYPFLAEPSSPGGIAVLSYIATVITAAIPTVIAALLVFRLAGDLGSTRSGALFAAVVYGLGSPAWCYATLFFGHALSTSCLMAAFAAAVSLRAPSSSRRDWLLASIVGAGGGWATVTEHTAAIPAALIALLAVIHAGSVPHRRRRRVIADVTVTALACAAILVVYNVLSFGGPFSLGYANEIAFEDMSRGFFGITSPRSDIMIELLFGQFRGLFFLAPVLAVAPIGLALLARDPLTRPSAFTGAAILVYYVVLNSSYSYWDGGWSFGPRHMAPVLPLMGLALATVWSRARPAVRAGLCALALYSVGLTLVAVSTTAQPPDNVKRPVSELLWPNFVNGRVSTNWQSFVEDGLQNQRDPETHAWNVGEELGLTGLASLTPLAAIWAVIIAGYWWARQKANRPPAGALSPAKSEPR